MVSHRVIDVLSAVIVKLFICQEYRSTCVYWPHAVKINVSEALFAHRVVNVRRYVGMVNIINWYSLI